MRTSTYYTFSYEDFDAFDSANVTLNYTIPDYKRPCRALPSIPASLVKEIFSSPDGLTLAIKLKAFYENLPFKTRAADTYLAYNLLLICANYTLYGRISGYHVFGDDLVYILSSRPLDFEDLPLILASYPSMKQTREILERIHTFDGKLGDVDERPLIPVELHLANHAAVIGAYILYYPSVRKIRQLLKSFKMNIASVRFALGGHLSL